MAANNVKYFHTQYNNYFKCKFYKPILRNDVKTTVDVMKFYVIRINTIKTRHYSNKVVELYGSQNFSILLPIPIRDFFSILFYNILYYSSYIQCSSKFYLSSKHLFYSYIHRHLFESREHIFGRFSNRIQFIFQHYQNCCSPK